MDYSTYTQWSKEKEDINAAVKITVIYIYTCMCVCVYIYAYTQRNCCHVLPYGLYGRCILNFLRKFQTVF